VKYIIIIAMLMLTSACTSIQSARVSVNTDDTRRFAQEMTQRLDAHVSPEQPICPEQHSAPEPVAWDLPPFNWPPGSCNKRSHESTWPDYSKVLTTECTWWFFPRERDASVCQSSWELGEEGLWTMIEMKCRHLNKLSY
jgi:hypothetical protein